MEPAIKGLPNQFVWEPVVENAGNLEAKPPLGGLASKFIVCGMGGSHLAAGFLKIANPKLDLLIHRDYGLPRVPDYFLKDSLIIASSYSGNTAETIDAFKSAHDASLKTAVITTGGILLDLAKSSQTSYIQLPTSNLPPRLALGHSIKAMAKLVGDQTTLNELAKLCDFLHPDQWQEAGKNLSEKLSGRIPIIYSSTINLPLAYFWKIQFNETGKVSAFYNVLPELNHNELQSFDQTSDTFHFIFLHDEADDHRIHQRMSITADLLSARGWPVTVLKVAGDGVWEKIFNNVLLAAWTAYYTALKNNHDPEAVPLIEEFKKLIV
ncbi:MAG: hypothetical protein HYT48_03520 [Candidatus Vogelbacteria bacterium]|nr:hypothetical protein [Candidatus Vogelbacteria bacterium]